MSIRLPEEIATRPADDLTPQQALASAIGGRILGPDAIQVGTRLVVASVTGVVRVDGTPIGRWHDSTDALAARFREVAA